MPTVADHHWCVPIILTIIINVETIQFWKKKKTLYKINIWKYPCLNTIILTRAYTAPPRGLPTLTTAQTEVHDMCTNKWLSTLISHYTQLCTCINYVPQHTLCSIELPVCLQGTNVCYDTPWMNTSTLPI